MLSHFRPVASPRCWQEYVNLLHVRQLDAAAGRTPLPPGCSATGKPQRTVRMVPMNKVHMPLIHPYEK